MKQASCYVDVDEHSGRITLCVPRQNIEVEINYEELVDLCNYAEGAWDLVEEYRSFGRFLKSGEKQPQPCQAEDNLPYEPRDRF